MSRADRILGDGFIIGIVKTRVSQDSAIHCAFQDFVEDVIQAGAFTANFKGPRDNSLLHSMGKSFVSAQLAE